jgi:hypothetical protein
VDDSVTSVDQAAEVRGEQVGFDELDPLREPGTWSTARDRTDAVSADDKARDERPAEDTCCACEENDHCKASAPLGSLPATGLGGDFAPGAASAASR